MMNNQIKDYIDFVNIELGKIDLTGNPKELYQPIRYILDLGGKRIRPLLTLLSYGMYKGNPLEILKASLAVEVFHNFTLMHDDIMDKAPIRRSKPTVQEKWNENIAILSGDAMLVKAYDHLLDIPQNKLGLAIKRFNKCAVEVCEGQQWDMNFEKDTSVSVIEYLQMITLKTAVLLGFSLELGAILADASVTDQRRLKEMGINLGIGFQLMDDLLDVYAEKGKFGKQIGGDIISNKKTFLLIKALEMANDDQRKELEFWLQQEEFDQKTKVAAVKKVYEQTGIKLITEKKIRKYFDKGYKNLDQIEVEDKKKHELRSLIDFLVSRDN